MFKDILRCPRQVTFFILVASLALGSTPIALAAQADPPTAPSDLPAPEKAALLAQTGAVQTIDEAPRVDMIALPWDDPSIRVPPPRQFNAMRAAETASATFQIDFLAAGTKDPLNSSRKCLDWPGNAQAAFIYAASIWASLIYSPVPIRIDTCWTDMGSTNILGSSGSNAVRDFANAPVANTFYSFSLADKFAGSDLYPSYAADTYISYNSTFAWYHGTDGLTPTGQYDFATVVLHEMGHSLNFSGRMTYGASSCTKATYGCWGTYPYPGIYDRFVENGSGQALLNESLFPDKSAELGSQLTGNNLVFDGPNATAANGGSPVKIYAPTTWVSGSSYSHLDYDTYSGTGHKLMVYAISSASSIHDPGAVTMGLLKDLGWAPTVSIDDVSVTEGNTGTTDATFTISLSHTVPWAASVSWATAPGTATAGLDYVTATGTATVPAGATSQTVAVQVTGDTTVESDETFYVNLANAPGARGFTDNQGLGTITNDDSGTPSAVEVGIVRSGATGMNVLLSWQPSAPNTGYEVWGDGAPYFVPDDYDTPLGEVTVSPWTFEDLNVLGDPDVHHFYTVRALKGTAWADSSQVGEFEFSLVSGSE